MLFLLLSVLFNVLIYAHFKYMANKGVKLFPAILVNYMACAFLGVTVLLVSNTQISIESNVVFWSSMSGLSFITMFNLMALLTAVYGLGTASVVSRMSLVIPVLFW